MKPTYSGFEAKKNSGFATLPPAGAYVAEIQGVKVQDCPYNHGRDEIVCMVEITEGEYAGQYHKVFEEQKNSFGGDIKYKGTISLMPPVDGDEPWVRGRFEGALWCVEQSNPGYHWDWDETKLKGKKVGINIRNRIYYGRDGSEKTTTEIGQFETVQDVRDGKVKPLKDRLPKNKPEAEQNFTDVSGDVEVPF